MLLFSRKIARSIRVWYIVFFPSLTRSPSCSALICLALTPEHQIARPGQGRSRAMLKRIGGFARHSTSTILTHTLIPFLHRESLKKSDILLCSLINPEVRGNTLCMVLDGPHIMCANPLHQRAVLDLSFNSSRLCFYSSYYGTVTMLWALEVPCVMPMCLARHYEMPGCGQCSQPSRPDARALASYSPVRPGQGG